MIEIVRTDSENTDFIELVRHLDAELAIRDGDDHAFYAQFNKIAKLKHVVLAYEDRKALGCGAIRELESGDIEIKRMFVPLESRGKGIATKVLLELEDWARELSFTRCVLETGFKQPEAIRLYEKNGYERIPNYGQYADVGNSVCFGKNIYQRNNNMQKVTTFLMFNDQAEDAMNLYTSVFKDGKIIDMFSGPDGKVMGGTFEIGGQQYSCYNAGPHPNFKFTQAISLMIRADTQDEIDHYYDKLSEGGKQEPCGWLDDKFGVSWQITPKMLVDTLTGPDREKADRVMEAIFKMNKIIIADIETAAAG